MSEPVAGVAFELKLDGSKLTAGFKSSGEEIKKSITKSFAEAGKSIKKTVKTDSSEIRAVLNDTSKSVKSKAVAIAEICQKRCDSIADAMKKAWSRMKKESSDSSQSTKKDMEGTAQQASKNAAEIENDFSGSFSAIAKKAGKALASVFAVKKLVDFGKACLELGSDLAEVQNVVDVTFPSMSKQVDEFAQNAAASFGLSETMAKQFAGTFGSMAKAFGFSEKQAHDMGTALTGLAGDVASFYNITQEEAYTKLKSVFTGETESLKDLGIVMTQTALDSYALANGFGKTTSKMTEAEKVALRYRFVQEQLAGAAGDFVRTSDGWANQVRVLKLQFDSLKATIGQGLINVLTPVIRLVNTLVGKLFTLANAFKAFTEMFSGKKEAGDTAGQIQGIAAAAEAAGDAAEASVKKINGLFAFDDMNVVNSSSDSASGGAAEGYGAVFSDMGTIDTSGIEEADSRLQSLVDRAKELAAVFREGFSSGLGDSGGIGDAGRLMKEAGDALAGIFASPEIITGADSFAESITRMLGSISGAAAGIGVTAARNIVGGITGYLKKNSGRMKSHFLAMFDIWSEIVSLAGDLSAAIANVFGAFGEENGQQFTGNLLGIFADAHMGVEELSRKLSRDVLGAIIRPFSDNQEDLRAALDGFLAVLADASGTVKASIDETFDGLNEIYDAHFRPFFDSVSQGLSYLLGQFLDFWDGSVQPLLGEWGEKFDALFTGSIQPMFSNFSAMLGEVADLLKLLWENALVPLIDWVAANVLPVVLSVKAGVVDAFFALAEGIAERVNGIITVIRGITEFLTGVFTADWEKAWDGIVKIFDGVKAMMKGTVNGILGIVESLANGVIRGINHCIDSLNRLSFDVPDWVPEIGGKSIGFSLSSIPEVSIPKLAGGGYVRANTPQLAMIGDNRHQGEVIAPEDKIYQICAQAMKDVMQQFMAAMASMMNNGMSGKEVTVVVRVTGEMAPFVRLLKAELDKEQSRTGVNFRVVCE